MTEDISTPKTMPRAVQRLEGPEALLTAEYNIQDLPSITEVDDVEDAPAAGSRPPPPPSRRTSTTAFTGGAAAPLGALGTRAPLITRPKPPQVAVRLAPVVVAADPGATLPPRDQREAPRSPAAQRTPQLATAPRLARGRPSLVAIGAAFGCTLGYALWATVLRPGLAGAAPEPGPPLPAFLQAAGATTGGAPNAAPPAVPAPRSTLPPELAATLAKALPPIAGNEVAANVDAGVPPVDSIAEPLAPPIPDVLTSEPAAAPERPAVTPSSSRESHRFPDAKVRPPLAKAKADPAFATGSQTPSRIRPARSSRSLRASAANSAAVSSRPTPPPEGSERAANQADRPASAAATRPLTNYTYEDKALFAIDTAPMRVTDLVLERGETLVSQPTAGDAARWVITVVSGEAQTHVFVQPLRSGLRTNLTLTTTRRTYFLELSSHEDGTYMAGVEWQYPGDDAARRQEALVQAARERQSSTSIADLQALRFDYRVQVTAGDPSWKPTMVFDDGRKTFIRFPRPVAAGTSPILLIGRTGTSRDAKYVNYRVKNDLYVVDHLFESAELQLASGDAAAEVVRITRKH